MPDANKENTLNQLVSSGRNLFLINLYYSYQDFLAFQVGAAFGAAGQRCMALSTAVFVGDAAKWIPDLVDRAQKLKVNAGVLRDVHRCFGFSFTTCFDRSHA